MAAITQAARELLAAAVAGQPLTALTLKLAGIVLDRTEAATEVSAAESRETATGGDVEVEAMHVNDAEDE